MAINFNTGGGGGIPWFLFDINNAQLITSPHTIPGDITDTKGVVLSETPIPGRNYQTVQYGGGENRKISFTLPLVRRNDTVGNILLLKQVDLLRNQAVGLTNVFSTQFIPNPQVLYYWGTGSVPLVYYVSKCDPVHKTGFVNRFGQPQYSDISIELILDEENPIYRTEEVFRRVASLLGLAATAYDLVTGVPQEKPI